MWLRRGFRVIQFGAAVALPLWLLIGRGLIVEGPGWEFVFLLFVSPVLAVAMLTVGGLTLARKTVRQQGAVSWLDVSVLSAWYLMIIAAGFVAHTAVAVMVVVFAVAAFWAAVWQLYTETRRRVTGVMAGIGPTVVQFGQYNASRQPSMDVPEDRRIIRIDPPNPS
ncbi:MAG: transporter [Homoserinimonas sp.]|nr:transporter [Homoserinimonas sp.]